MNDNMVTSATGQSSTELLNSPNADQTNSLRSTRSLANLLAACVEDPTVTASLFVLTTPAGGPPPSNTAQALANLARDPGQNVEGIYALTLLSSLYTPQLVTMPDAWTVTVKVNDSGNDEPDFLISGPGNLAFDQRGYAWVTNNTTQGSPNSCTFNLVLKPNGQPADGSNGTPRSPLTGGVILGARFRRHGPSPRLGVVRQLRLGQSRLRLVLSNHEWKRQHVTLHADRHASVTA